MVIHSTVTKGNCRFIKIDLILTDPPYGKEYLQLYEKLAILAVKVLNGQKNVDIKPINIFMPI
jgi:16S rRNA G966 N2-methylase RsmD